MELTRGFEMMGDRYKYDFEKCHFKDGWAQLDTKQDASYYGNWVNPSKRLLFSYCEGDTTLTTCTDDEDFKTAVRECCEWHKERGYFIGIDCACVVAIEAEFDRLGLSEFLHGRVSPHPDDVPSPSQVVEYLHLGKVTKEKAN